MYIIPIPDSFHKKCIERQNSENWISLLCPILSAAKEEKLHSELTIDEYKTLFSPLYLIPITFLRDLLTSKTNGDRAKAKIGMIETLINQSPEPERLSEFNGMFTYFTAGSPDIQAVIVNLLFFAYATMQQLENSVTSGKWSDALVHEKRSCENSLGNIFPFCAADGAPYAQGLAGGESCDSGVGLNVSNRICGILGLESMRETITTYIVSNVPESALIIKNASAEKPIAGFAGCKLYLGQLAFCAGCLEHVMVTMENFWKGIRTHGSLKDDCEFDDEYKLSLLEHLKKHPGHFKDDTETANSIAMANTLLPKVFGRYATFMRAIQKDRALEISGEVLSFIRGNLNPCDRAFRAVRDCIEFESADKIISELETGELQNLIEPPNRSIVYKNIAEGLVKASSQIGHDHYQLVAKIMNGLLQNHFGKQAPHGELTETIRGLRKTSIDRF
jgi:hypothetical protein